MKKLFESWRGHLSSLDETMKDLKDVKAKYAEDPQMSKVIAKFEEIDPSDNHKYIRWMTKQAEKSLKQGNLEQDIAEIIDSVRHFHKFSGMASIGRNMPKDLNAYKSLEALTSDIDDAKREAEEAKAKKEKEAEAKKRASLQAKEESDLVYDDDKFMVIRPTSEYASCYYGRGTRWCISATEAGNYFDRYTSEGRVFYFVLDKTRKNVDPLKKVAWVADKGDFEEYFNAPDDSIDRSEADSQLKETDPDKADEIIDTMEKHLAANPPDNTFEQDVEELVNDYSDILEHTTIALEILDDVGSGDMANISFDTEFSIPRTLTGIADASTEETLQTNEALKLVYDVIEGETSLDLRDSGYYEDSELPISTKGGKVIVTFGIPFKYVYSKDDAEEYLHEIRVEIDNKSEELAFKIFAKFVEKGLVPPSFNMKLGQQVEEEKGVWNWDYVSVSYDDDDGEIDYSIEISQDEYSAILQKGWRGRNSSGLLAILSVCARELRKKDRRQLTFRGMEPEGEPSSLLLTDGVRVRAEKAFRREAYTLSVFDIFGDEDKSRNTFEVFRYIEKYPGDFKRLFRKEIEKIMPLSEQIARKNKPIKIKLGGTNLK